MKRIICLVIAITVFLLPGCQLPQDKPTGKETTKSTSETENKNESLKDFVFEEQDVFGDQYITPVKSSDALQTTAPTQTSAVQTGSTPVATSSIGVQNEKMSVIAYYGDADGAIIPATRDIPRQEGIAKSAIKCLIDNEENRNALKTYGLEPVLPQGTEVQGINISGGIASIDFNNNILSYKDKDQEKRIISSIVYTLTEFNTINGVILLVNGYEQKNLKYGNNGSGILSRDNVLINSEKVNADSRLKKLDVYFYKYINDKEYILPVSMEYAGVDQKEIPGEMVRLFSKKFDKEQLYSQLPENVGLLSWEIKDKVLILNFNNAITKYGGTARENGILKQILYTMKNIKGIEKVRILIEGKSQGLPEGTDISEDLTLPIEINRV